MDSKRPSPGSNSHERSPAAEEQEAEESTVEPLEGEGIETGGVTEPGLIAFGKCVS